MLIRMLDGVGVVASKKRNILPGNEFNAFFPIPAKTDPYLTFNGSNNDTLNKYIPDIARRFKSDTARIAQFLKGRTIDDTCRNIWNFCYKYIQYQIDSPFEEQIRRPARSWADRKSGVDCDCYSTFISSILQNLNIPHYVRMAAYNYKRGFQHVYIIVPKYTGANVDNFSNYITIDPVMDAYNAEKRPMYQKADCYVVPTTTTTDIVIPSVSNNEKLLSISGLNGIRNHQPIRFLNGSPIVLDQVFYNPELRTWALKGLNGEFYIRGEQDNVYVSGLGDVGVGWIGSALKIGGKILKGAGKFIGGGVKAIAGGAVKTAANAVNNTVAAATGIANNTVAAANTNIAAANTNLDKQLTDTQSTLEKSVKASNKAAVTSLNNLNDGIKTKLDTHFTNVSKNLDTVLAQNNRTTATIDDVNKALKQLNAVSAGNQIMVKELHATVAKQSSENETFRNKTKTSLVIITATGFVVAAILLVLFMKSNKQIVKV